MPGIVSPRDIKEITVETLSEMVKNGYQFDYWEGAFAKSGKYKGLTAYYLRPSTKRSAGRIVDASWGGECVFLTETGCSKTFEERPSQCKALIPGVDGCDFGGKGKKYEKVPMIRSWLPHNQVILDTIEKLSSEQ